MYRNNRSTKNAGMLFWGLLAAAILIFAAPAIAQVSSIDYPNGNCINDMVIQGDYVWCATTGSLVRWNKADGTYRQFTEKDGLASYYCYCIKIDARDNLWIGTLKGVQRFDGNTFTTFNTSNSGLVNDEVLAIAVANDGVIWFGTSGGLSRFDGTAWTSYTTGNSDIPANYVNSIAIDNDGVIWLAHNEYGNRMGASSFDGAAWKSYTRDTSGLKYASVSTIAVDADNVKWFGTESRLYSFDGQTWTEHSTLAVNDMTLDSTGVLWAATGFTGDNSQATYSLLSRNGSTWTNHPLDKELDRPIMFYKCIRVDTNGTIWFVTQENYGTLSLHSYDGTTMKTYNTDGPLSYISRGIAIDRSNRKWFATDYGMSCFDGKTWTNHLFSLTFDGVSAPKNFESLKSFVNTTNGVVVDLDNVVWTCNLMGYNVMRYDGTTWKNYNYVTDTSSEQVITYDILVDKNNVKWFVGVGITSFDGTTWTLYKQNEIYALAGAVDMDNVKWFCTAQEGVWSFDGTTWTNYFTENSPIAGYVTSVVVDKNNVKWFRATVSLTNTSEGKIYSFDGITWKTYEPEVTGISGAGDSKTLFVDNNNVLWVASKNLFSFDGTTWKSWPNIKARTMAFDNDGYAWLASFYSVGDGGTLSALKFSNPTTVEETEALPSAITITGNRPNPFNPSTTISFTLPASGRAVLSIYNITGQKVRDLVNAPLSAGTHSVVWDGRDASGKLVSSGVYLSRLTLGKHTATGRMLLAK